MSVGTVLNAATLPANKNRSPNQGLAAVTLICLITAALSACFVLRHSKLVRCDHLTALAVAAQLPAWISKPPPSIGVPDE